MEGTIDFLRLYEEIFRILPSGDIQQLMEACYQVVGVPILTVDIMYNLFGIYPQEKTGDYYWDYLLENRGYSPEMAVHMYETGIMQSANRQETPYVVDWSDANTDFPKIQGIIKVNDVIEGYVTMQCRRDEVTPERMQAMKIIQEALALFFRDSDSENSMELTYQKAFVGELLNNRIHTQRQLGIWYKNVGLRPEPPYRVAAVSIRDENAKNVLSHVCRTVLQFSPYQLALIQHSILYIFQYNLNQNINTRTSEKQFNEILTRFDAHCGLSVYFENLLEIDAYRMQAEAAMTLGRKRNPKYHIHAYEDYYLPAILAPRIEEMPRCNYLSPILTKLSEYDRQHSTDFLKTLRAYVVNICNTADTAAQLHIHRNTLLYRIAKIEELTGASLKEPQTFMHLMISFYMLGFSGEKEN